MNTHDIDIELPPLPDIDASDPEAAQEILRGFGLACAHLAIEADRKRKGEVVVTKTPEGEIIAVTRQDDEGRILSVIAEADSKRRGEPVTCFKCGHPTHRGECVNVVPQPADWQNFTK